MDDASGWADRGVGDVHDMHKYPGPGSPEPEANRAAVLGRIRRPGPARAAATPGRPRRTGATAASPTAESLTIAYLDLVAKLFPLIAEKGLSAAVYTQTTDVEVEVNGLMTYDREVVKMDLKRVSAANRGSPVPQFSPLTPAGH